MTFGLIGMNLMPIHIIFMPQIYNLMTNYNDNYQNLLQIVSMSNVQFHVQSVWVWTPKIDKATRPFVGSGDMRQGL